MPKSRKKSGEKKKVANVARHRPAVTVTEEEKNMFEEKYTSKHLIVNLIHIWRDSAPMGFISYFPVMLLYLAYCVLWFLDSVLLLVPEARNFAVAARNAMLQISPYVGALGLPVVLTYLHTRYNIAHSVYYYLKNLLYVFPATILYIALCYLNFIVAVMFQSNAGELIVAVLKTSWVPLATAGGAILLCSAVAQAVLMSRRARDEAVKTPLGLVIPKKKKD